MLRCWRAAELEGSGQRGYISDRTVVVNVLCNNIAVRGSRTTIGLRLQLVWIVSFAFYKVVGHSHKNGVVPKNTAFLYRRCTLLLHKIHNKENFTQCNFLLLQ